MSNDVPEAMKEGIKSSKVFLACINQRYRDSEACMSELREAVRMRKPIITIIIEESGKKPEEWAGEELLRLCRIPKSSLYCDISDIYKNWAEKDDVTKYNEQLDKLETKLKEELDVKHEIEKRELVSSKVIHICSRFFCSSSGSNKTVNNRSNSAIGSSGGAAVNSPFQHATRHSTK